MSDKKILIAEDEAIVAKDLCDSLKSLGYLVAGVVRTGEEAIEKAADKADLILMDIRLAGKIDGIEATRQIRSRFSTPVIYLTAYADEEMLERAKVTEPFGYLVKPFQERELRPAIEMALYKSQAEKEFEKHRTLLAATLKNMGDGIIITDPKERITFMNGPAEVLTGWKRDKAIGKDFSEVLKIIDEETGISIKNPIARAFSQDTPVKLPSRAAVIGRDSRATPICDSVNAIRDDQGNILGAVLVFFDLTEYRRVEKKILEDIQYEKQRAGAVLREDVCQQLAAVSLMMKFIEEQIATNATLKTKDVNSIIKLIDQAINQSRDLAQQLCGVVPSEQNGIKGTTAR